MPGRLKRIFPPFPVAMSHFLGKTVTLSSSNERGSKKHPCPACGAHTISSWAKVKAGMFLPLICSGCGSMIGGKGIIWGVSSIIIFLTVYGSISLFVNWSLDDLLITITFLAFLKFVIIDRAPLSSFGKVFSGTVSPQRGLNKEIISKRLHIVGVLSSIVSSMLIIIAPIGIFYSISERNFIPLVICVGIWLIANPIMNRISQRLEMMHLCPVCGASTISSWARMRTRAKCSNCGSKVEVIGGILGWLIVLQHMVFFAGLYISLVNESWIPFLIIFSLSWIAMGLTIINFLPLVGVPKKREK